MPDSESEQVKELHRILGHGLPELVGPDGKERIRIPQSVYDVLKRIVRDMQLGRSITVVRDDADFTTQRAADYLGVSRPHLIKLLETQAIPFHMVGSHRRIKCRDLVAYAQKRNVERRAILDGLARNAFAAGHYDNVVLPPGAEDE
jgi:excisionase family DNA binding protein